MSSVLMGDFRTLDWTVNRILSSRGIRNLHCSLTLERKNIYVEKIPSAPNTPNASTTLPMLVQTRFQVGMCRIQIPESGKI